MPGMCAYVRMLYNDYRHTSYMTRCINHCMHINRKIFMVNFCYMELEKELELNDCNDGIGI